VAVSNIKIDPNDLTEIMLTVALNNNEFDLDDLSEIILKMALSNNKTDLDDLFALHTWCVGTRPVSSCNAVGSQNRQLQDLIQSLVPTDYVLRLSNISIKTILSK